MRPTKKQAKAEVEELSKLLKGLSEAQSEYLTHSVFGNTQTNDGHRFYHLKGGRGWCTHCAHTFRMEGNQRVVVCPNCGERLIPVQCTKRTFTGFGYSAVLSVIGDWQVVRYYCTKTDSKQGAYDAENSCWKDGKTNYYNFEFLRKWFNTKTGFIVTERTATGMCARYQDQPYSMYSDLWVAQSETYWTSEWFRFFTCPYGHIHKELRRRGFSFGNIRKMEYVSKCIQSVFACPFAETLLKKKNVNALNYFSQEGHAEKLNQFKEQIRIATKHGFNFSDTNMSDYLDYLGQLIQLGYDTHSPKYLCPSDLDVEHSRLNRLIERKNIEARRKQYISDYEHNKAKIEAEYDKKIARYRNLLITDGLIEIRPLQSVREFVDEGAEMKHCVFWNKYYDAKKHPHSLILSAKIHGERIETIEVSTSYFRVEQSRGFENKPTGRHGEILALMEQNMPVIRKIARSA